MVNSKLNKHIRIKHYSWCVCARNHIKDIVCHDLKFTDEESKAQRSQVLCSRSQSMLDRLQRLCLSSCDVLPCNKLLDFSFRLLG